MRSLLALVLGAIPLVLAHPSPRAAHVVHEQRAAEPVGWSKVRRLEAHAVLPLRIGLKQRNLDTLSELLDAISHPDSPMYGQHWSADQVARHFAPSDATVHAVKRWLVDAGLAPERVGVSYNKGWIEVNVTVSEAESLLQTEYHVYAHPSGVEQIGCQSYSVREHVREHVDLVRPTVHFNHRAAGASSRRFHKRSAHRPDALSDDIPGVKVDHKPTMPECDRYTTPACLRALYNIDWFPISTQKNSFAVVEFTPQAYLEEDLDLFFNNFSKSMLGQRPTLVPIDGGIVQTLNQSFYFNAESNLDLQYSMTLVAPQKVTLLQAGDVPEGASFDNWLDAVDESFCTYQGGDDPLQDGIYPDLLPGGSNQSASCGVIRPPYVMSISYGQGEHTVTPAYAHRQCAEYGKLGMMGTTVLYPSGDFGVAGNQGQCLDADGQAADNGTRFNPDFPVGCPFVTAVGATQIDRGAAVHQPESACRSDVFSGGGFSNIFPMPSYQATAVSKYFRDHRPPYTSSQFNNTGRARGFPDLSANGGKYVFAINGEFRLINGTSASSPVVGAIITLINDARLNFGKGPVGFINPAIYSSKFACGFTDIKSGGNPGCGTPGFTAVPGWDPVTGVGTPNLATLLPLFLTLP
ncbi:subtilisin-like protein [Auriscalpium vulgare]|uniref:Subtilisin-like protein n=1 Tax=Auriscalpium vulgare TaxID=40419 RepID=A0ACB8RW78_9AGAM|nr:subtilisin-like protein [Auriscalpium vulgare]